MVASRKHHRGKLIAYPDGMCEYILLCTSGNNVDESGSRSSIEAPMSADATVETIGHNECTEFLSTF